MDVNRTVLACDGGENRSSNQGHEELGRHYSNPPETPDEQRRFRFRPERQRVPPCSLPTEAAAAVAAAQSGPLATPWQTIRPGPERVLDAAGPRAMF